jgi:hypothetical protein
MTQTVNIASKAAQPARQFGRGRVLRIVLGSLGLLVALAFVAAGSVGTWALLSHRDGSGYFTTATHHYGTSSYALSTESLAVTGLTGAFETLGRIRIAATSSDAAKPLFIAIAKTEDVNRYLARVEHDELRDITFDPFGVDYRRTSGDAPAAPPAAQSFWRAQATGTGTQTIAWPVSKGRWSAVVMNADGSRAVSVDAQLAARVSGAWWIVTGLFVLGGLSLLGGGTLVYSGARKRTPVSEEA